MYGVEQRAESGQFCQMPNLIKGTVSRVFFYTKSLRFDTDDKFVVGVESRRRPNSHRCVNETKLATILSLVSLTTRKEGPEVANYSRIFSKNISPDKTEFRRMKKI